MPPYRQAGRPAPVRRPSTGRVLPYGFVKLAAVCAVVIVLAVVLQMLWPEGFPLVKTNSTGVKTVATISEIHTSGPIRINEVMSSNRNTLSIADGSTPDWIEVINVTDSSVEIGGYQLAKSANATMVFTFPDMWLEAGEAVLVYCDSRIRENALEDLHAPFRISSAGDTLLLFNAEDTAVDTVNIPALSHDQSYVRMDTALWQKCETPTPGLANNAESYEILTRAASDSPIIVNEIMSTNKRTLADENGHYYDYIELYNRSGEVVRIEGWYLSDDAASSRKWRFPDVSINPGEFLVVYASKLDRKDDAAYLHTNFGLSSEGEQVVLSDANGRVMDSVSFDLLRADQAYARQADGTWTVANMASPGRAN